MRVRSLLVALLLVVACSSPKPEPEPQVVPEQAPQQQATGTVRVTASTLNVRQDASASSAIVARVKRGDQLTVLEAQNGWSKVRLPNGDVGWVSSQHVTSKPLRKGCPPDSDYSFVKAPLAAFSESGPHGLVVVEATVNTSGDVTATKVVSNSTGDSSLAGVAEREIRTAKFKPPYRDCVPRGFIFTYKRSF